MREVELGQRSSSKTWRLWFAPFAAVVVAILAGLPPAPASGQGSDATVVTFDDYPANISGSGAAPPITTEYASQGLVFRRGVTALLFNDRSFPPRPDLPRSGDTVITTCYSQEFCSSTITMEFNPPLAELTVYAGYSQGLDRSADLLLEGFNRDGNVIVRSIVTVPAADQATPATNAVTIEDSSGEIAGAQVRWVEEKRFLSHLIVDDVTLSPFVPLAELAVEPTPVELEVGTEVATETIGLSNVGNVPLSGVFLTLDGFNELIGETGVAIGLDQNPQCLRLIEVGGSCQVSIVATPDAENETAAAVSGVLAVRAATGAPIQETPVRISIDPPPPPTTEATTTTETTTTTATEPTETTEAGETTEATTTSAPTDDQVTPASEDVATTTSTAQEEEDEDRSDETTINSGLIVAGLIVLGLVLRWLIRRPKKPPLDPPPPPDVPPPPQASPVQASPVQPRPPEQQPDQRIPRPSLSAKPDLGTQTIDTPGGARPSLVVALNDHRSATTLIDHKEGTVQ